MKRERPGGGEARYQDLHTPVHPQAAPHQLQVCERRRERCDRLNRRCAHAQRAQRCECRAQARDVGGRGGAEREAAGARDLGQRAPRAVGQLAGWFGCGGGCGGGGRGAGSLGKGVAGGGGEAQAVLQPTNDSGRPTCARAATSAASTSSSSPSAPPPPPLRRKVSSVAAEYTSSSWPRRASGTPPAAASPATTAGAAMPQRSARLTQRSDRQSAPPTSGNSEAMWVRTVGGRSWRLVLAWLVVAV